MKFSTRLIAGFVLAFGSLFLASAPAIAAPFDPSGMAFPLDGDSRITDSFGDCRGSGCSRAHEGVDIMTAKGVPVLAVGDGVVSWISSGPGDCCYLGIDHGGGWVTRYIHLNDDRKDAAGNYIDNTDGQGWGIAEGLAEGIAVTRGQVIGWAGDSGNAAETVSHLHFELRKNGTPIDAYPYLVNALGGWDGRFQDDDGNVHEKNIEIIAQRGVTLGCNPPLNNRFCPEDQITRGQMAAFIARALDLPEGGEIPYTDVVGNKFEPAIRAIEAAGIGFGCTQTEFCPGVPLLRHEMAELLVRAFGYDNPTGTNYFVDDEGNQFEVSINALAAQGVTMGCNPPANTKFCPDMPLKRSQMATFFVRAMP